MSTSTRARSTPAELYGPLLAAVQERAVLADGKTFVDAVPRRPVADIMADFATFAGDDEALRCFVIANFELPTSERAAPLTSPTISLREHIRAMWPRLARAPADGSADSSVLPVRHRHVVPGGRFRELYYWDSFFTLLGLMRDGETALATGIVDIMTDLIEEHGHVPNGARTYYLGRSQPPLYYMMVARVGAAPLPLAARRLAAMKREHAWWMRGAEMLKPGTQRNRVAMLADGSIVNRYWDPRDTPRDESWGEDIATALRSGRPLATVYRDLRAGAESGWDFSSRWCDGDTLATIRTTTIAPVDLNAILYGLERAIAAADDEDSNRFRAYADRRQATLRRHFWSVALGCYVDHDLAAGRQRENITAAALTPLLTGVASFDQAEATAAVVADLLLAPGGMRTTAVRSGQQWDLPNGWAPLQWIASAGLRRYGQTALSDEIVKRWLATVEAAFRQTGLIYEKYDIESGLRGQGGEYAVQDGFGWTNGVTAEFLDWQSITSTNT